MWFVLIGCALGALKLAEISPVALWSWWWVLSPFGAAAVWWYIADATGGTQRRAMAAEDKRVAARRLRHLKDMGLDTFSRKGPRKPPSGGSSS